VRRAERDEAPLGMGGGIRADDDGQRDEVGAPHGVVLDCDPIVAPAGRVEVQAGGLGDVTLHGWGSTGINAARNELPPTAIRAGANGTLQIVVMVTWRFADGRL
jgi:hypothetical protein